MKGNTEDENKGKLHIEQELNNNIDVENVIFLINFT